MKAGDVVSCMSWLLVLIHRLGTEGILNDDQRLFLKLRILAVKRGDALLRAFDAYAAGDRRDELIEMILGMLPTDEENEQLGLNAAGKHAQTQNAHSEKKEKEKKRDSATASPPTSQRSPGVATAAKSSPATRDAADAASSMSGSATKPARRSMGIGTDSHSSTPSKSARSTSRTVGSDP
jgi:hypothetical protein